MTWIKPDQSYLLTRQYHDGANLNARAQLHIRFRTNKQGWSHWVFEQLHLPPNAHILELGCGPGWLWAENLERIPDGWQITLSDFSAGMLVEAQQNLQGSPHPFRFSVIDAQMIPFEDATFDAVIANHMLYHVPDIAKAIAEIHRVIKPGGHFYAATNGTKHLREIDELVQHFAPGQARIFSGSLLNRFTFETAEELIQQRFSTMRLFYYEDALVVTEAEPLVAYVLSTHPEAIQSDEQIAAFARFVEAEMSATGAIVITKDTGVFEAQHE
jgi:ubiquinone/menaquinone biosynthesis C-methylase UbiE